MVLKFSVRLQKKKKVQVLRIFFVRARLVDYLFPMSKVLKIRVGRLGKKKKGKKKRQKYL